MVTILCQGGRVWPQYRVIKRRLDSPLFNAAHPVNIRGEFRPLPMDRISSGGSFVAQSAHLRASAHLSSYVISNMIRRILALKVGNSQGFLPMLQGFKRWQYI
jgi:hypothetical protein